MKKTLLPWIFVCAYILLFSPLKAQNLSWARSIGGTAVDINGRVEILSNDDLLIGGVFGFIVDFDPGAGNGVLFANGLVDGFMAKYSSDGLYDEAYSISNPSFVIPYDLHVHGNDDVYIVGKFDTITDFDVGSSMANLTPNGNADGFLVKYDSAAALQWVRQFSSTDSVMITSVDVDAQGNIYIAGFFSGIADMDPGIGTATHNSGTGTNIFVTKLNSSGNYLWSESVGTGATFIESYDMEVNSNSDVFVYGALSGTADFDPGVGTNNITAGGISDVFLWKLNSNGVYQNTYQIGGLNYTSPGRIRIDGQDNIFLSGSFSNTLQTDPVNGMDSIVSNGSEDMFVLRYNSSMSLDWSMGLGGSGADAATTINLNNSGDVLVTGLFSGTVDFDPSTNVHNLSGSGSQDLFFASYDGSGNLNWAEAIIGNGDFNALSIVQDNNNGLYIGGAYTGIADFDPGTGTNNLISLGMEDMFLAKYSLCDSMTFSFNVTDATCGNNDGSVVANVNGGVGPYDWLWTSGDTTGTADSLSAGIYFVTVWDANNCTAQEEVIVSDVSGPSVTIQNQINVSCNGGADGALAISVSGGATPYTYQWSNGNSNQNINGLSAGTYEITVTDDDECQTTEQFVITEPAAISTSFIETEPTCGQADGILTVLASGGSGSYTYSWTPGGGTNATLSSIAAGVYRVTITDANSCSQTFPVALSDDNATDVTLDSIIHASCGGSGGSILISHTGGTPNFTYQWTPGSATTQDLTGVQPGEYDLIITDNVGCKAAFTATVEAQKPETPEICIVDVDSLTGKAQVLWEKPTSRGAIDFYKVYRETTSKGVFDLLDTVEYAALSLYTDNFADTWVRPWKYRISLVDTCGIESELSEPHTTIHTVITRGLGNDYNVLWTHYHGNFNYTQYDCFRYTDTDGWNLVTTVPSNVISYTDGTSPSNGDDMYYVMGIDHPTGCTATEAQSKNSSRSNRGSIKKPTFGLVGIPGIPATPSVFVSKVYPNPANDFIALEVSAQKSGLGMVEIFNIQGRKVLEQTFRLDGFFNESLHISDLPRGMYQLRISFEGSQQMHKFAIEQ